MTDERTDRIVWVRGLVLEPGSEQSVVNVEVRSKFYEAFAKHRILQTDLAGYYGICSCQKDGEMPVDFETFADYVDHVFEQLVPTLVQDEFSKHVFVFEKEDTIPAEELIGLVDLIEMNCPCGARPESLNTHPHVPGCNVEKLKRLVVSRTR